MVTRWLLLRANGEGQVRGGVEARLSKGAQSLSVVVVDQEIARRIADDWIKAWNRHDLDAIVEHYAEDVQFTSPFVVKLTGVVDGMLWGKLALREYFAGGLRAYPELKFELLQVLCGVGGFTLMYRSVDELLAAETMTIGAGNKITRAEVHYSEADSKAEREKPIEWHREGYLLTDNPQCKDLDAICSLLQSTYWADDRSREMIEKSLRHSECLHLLHEGQQVGMIRGVTDQATFTWVCDVIVHPEHRGKGLGKWLVQCFLEHPRLKTVSHHLCTKDAHGLYEEFGFQRIEAMRRSDRPMPFLLKT